LDPRFINEGWLQIAIEGAQSGELGDIFIESQMELIEMRAILYTPPSICTKFGVPFVSGAFTAGNTYMNMSNFSVSYTSNISSVFFNAVGFFKLTMTQSGDATAGTPTLLFGSNITRLYDSGGASTGVLNNQGLSVASGTSVITELTIFVAAVPSINNATNRIQLTHFLGATGNGNVFYDIIQTCGAMGNINSGSATIVAPGPNALPDKVNLLESKLDNLSKIFNWLPSMPGTAQFQKSSELEPPPKRQKLVIPPNSETELKSDTDSEDGYTTVPCEESLPFPTSLGPNLSSKQLDEIIKNLQNYRIH
jgi:hypothetical protein